MGCPQDRDFMVRKLLLPRYISGVGIHFIFDRGGGIIDRFVEFDRSLHPKKACILLVSLPERYLAREPGSELVALSA